MSEGIKVLSRWISVTVSVDVVSCSTERGLMSFHAPPMEAVREGNLVLRLNSESPEKSSVDFDVFVDGRRAYTGEVAPSPHSYESSEFRVGTGSHVVYVRSKRLDTWAATSVHVNQKTWVYITFWESREPERPISPQFRISTRLAEAPIY